MQLVCFPFADEWGNHAIDCLVLPPIPLFLKVNVTDSTNVEFVAVNRYLLALILLWTKQNAHMYYDRDGNLRPWIKRIGAVKKSLIMPHIRTETEKLAAELDQEKKGRKELTAKLDQEKKELTAEFAAKLDQEKKEREELTAKLDQEKKEREELTAKLDQEKKEREELTAKLDQEKKETEELTAKLDQEKKETEELTAKLKKAQNDMKVMGSKRSADSRSIAEDDNTLPSKKSKMSRKTHRKN